MATRFYDFGPFRVDKLNHVLMRNGETLPLKPKVFDTLLVLLENRKRVIDKDELLSRLWPDTVVEESNLTQNIYLLRKALGEETHSEIFIKTMPKRGYRFVAEVIEVEADAYQDPATLIRTRIATQESQPEFVTEPRIAPQPSTISEASPPRHGLSRWHRKAILFGGGLAVTILLSIWVGRLALNNRREAGLPSRQVKSLAVLPFKPLTSDVRDEALGFGLADTLITRLSNIKTLVVRPTASVRRFNSPDQDPIQAGRELRVDAVLDATVQRAGDRIRINFRLIRVSDGASLWTGKVEEQVNDPFAVQDRAAEQVAQMLAPQMTGEEQQLLARRYTEDPEAYRLYVLGRYHWNRNTVDEWKKAIEYFNAAIEKDPKYALPYTGLADSYLSVIADQTLPKQEGVQRARDAALMALKLDADLPEPHVSLARIKAYYDWDWSGAQIEFLRALQLGPNSAQAHVEYSSYLTTIGRNEEAVTQATQSRELDPLSPATHFGVAWALLGARRYDEVIRESESILTTFPVAQYWMGLAYLGKKQPEQAIQAFEKRLEMSPEDSLVKASLAFAYAAAGKRAEALKSIRELEQLFRRQQISPYNIALSYAGLGDKKTTFVWLERAFDQRSRSLWGLKVNPMWDSFKSESQFKSLLERMGLPQ